MENFNLKTGSLIALLAIGGLFQLAKSFPGAHTASWDLDNIRFGNEASPYSTISGHSGNKLPTAKPLPRVAALGGVDLKAQMDTFNKDNAPATLEFAHGKPGEKIAQKKEEFEIYIDPVTGKMMKRKKKKKKKKKNADDQKQEDIAKDEAVKDEPVPEEEKRIEQVVAEVAAAGGFQTDAVKKDQPVAGSLEDWMRLLLSTPDATETKHFVALYQGGKVTSAIFYQVVQAMLLDSRTDMKQLGVMAAGVTPSVRSFELLAEMQRVESPSSALRSSVDRFLEPYGTNLNYLNVVEKILAADNGYASILALHKLNAAAARYLVPSASASGDVGSSEQGDGSVVTASLNAQYFTRFLSVLENLALSSNDRSMAEEAKTTLADLRTLLGPVPAQASAS
jgi:hypothetical protein